MEDPNLELSKPYLNLLDEIATQDKHPDLELSRPFLNLFDEIAIYDKHTSLKNYLLQATKEQIINLNFGVPKLNIGPPQMLNREIQEIWLDKIYALYIDLITDYLIPCLNDKIAKHQKIISIRFVDLLKQAKYNCKIVLPLLETLTDKLQLCPKIKWPVTLPPFNNPKNKPPLLKGLKDLVDNYSPITSSEDEENRNLQIQRPDHLKKRVKPNLKPIKEHHNNNKRQNPNKISPQSRTDSPITSSEEDEKRATLNPEPIEEHHNDNKKQYPKKPIPQLRTDREKIPPAPDTKTTPTSPNGITKVKGDGNCLFRALALGILQSGKDHQYVRHAICDYLLTHKDKFNPFFTPEEIPGIRETPLSFQEYIQLMNKPRAYGGALEITAAAENWDIGIKVLHPNGKIHSTWHNDYLDTIYLRYSSEEQHYDFISNIEQFYKYLDSNSSTKLQQEIQHSNSPQSSSKELDAFKNNHSTNILEKEIMLIEDINIPTHINARPSNTLVISPTKSHKNSLLKYSRKTHPTTETSQTPPLQQSQTYYREVIDSKPTPTRNEYEVIINQIKQLSGKKRRSLYKHIHTYFSQIRIKRKANQSYRIKNTDTKSNTQTETNKEPPLDPQTVGVFNFSSTTLTSPDLLLLQKGLSFSPSTHKIDTSQFQVDLYNFCRNVRLRKFYEQKTLTNKSISYNNTNVVETEEKHYIYLNKFRSPSYFDPESTCKYLNTFIECVRTEMDTLSKKHYKTHDNLTSVERASLKDLINKIHKNKITIALADKGGGIVIIDPAMYHQKGDEYFIEQANSYTLTTVQEEDLLKSIIKARNNITTLLLETKVIATQHRRFINYNLQPKITGIKFYFKVHKASNIIDIPLRPIHPSIGSPNHQLSLILDAILKPLVNQQNIPSYLRDTNQLLYYVRNTQNLPKDIVIITSDVVSLYTNIPHNLGTATLFNFLLEVSHFTHDQAKAITEAVKHVVSLNYLRWQTSIYQQTRGVAMGTPLAVNYANIFMSAVDKKLHQLAPFIYKHYRYIDDNIFLVPKNKIDELIHICNSLPYTTIKYTWTIDLNNEGISFLDVWMKIHNNQITTRLYTKETDKHMYLHPTSYHPYHTIRSIPLAVLTRIKRLCTEEANYSIDKERAIQWLKARGYKDELITDAILKVDSKSALEHITQIERRRNNNDTTIINPEEPTILPLVITYNYKFKRAPSILQKYKHTLAASLQKPHRTLIAYRRTNNLLDLLVHPSYKLHITPTQSLSTHAKGFHQCKRHLPYRNKTCICGTIHSEGCRTCAHSVHQLSRIPKTKIKFLQHQFASCHTSNVIYAIWCRKCFKIYVGETRQKLSTRLDQHLRLMKNPERTEPIYKHFNDHHPKNAFITPLEVVKKSENRLLQVKESRWINLLQTLSPLGLNSNLDLQQRYLGNRLPNKDAAFTPTPPRARETYTPITTKKLKRLTPLRHSTPTVTPRLTRNLTPNTKHTSTPNVVNKSKNNSRQIRTVLQTKTPKATPDMLRNQKIEYKYLEEPYVQLSPYSPISSIYTNTSLNLSMYRISHNTPTHNKPLT